MILTRLGAAITFCICLLATNSFATDSCKNDEVIEAGNRDPEELYALGDQYYCRVAAQSVMVRSAGHVSGPRYLCESDFVSENFKKAIAWYTLAAQRKHRKAQLALANMYHDGEGVEKDDKQAFYWFNELAQQGDADGQYNTALFYHNSWGVDKDYKTALYLFNELARHGDSRGEYSVGVYYYNGWGIEQDRKQALEWIEKAAKQEHESAKSVLRNLGVSY